MKCVILCGGKGTRLREETEFKPKPLVEIGGHPIIWHIMKIYSHYDVNEFVNKMEFVVSNPQKAKEIGMEGRSVGLKNFDYKLYGSQMKEFITSIVNQKTV